MTKSDDSYKQANTYSGEGVEKEKRRRRIYAATIQGLLYICKRKKR